jgi:phospholipase C
MFGTLPGVRGFNDPRAIRLPDGNPVWVQAMPTGERYVPFRLDLHGSQSTWMGSLPHSWTDQVDARNEGRYDRWLEVKKSGRKAFAKMPLTLAYYARADLPFYYALADAFTICDQHFCSTLTGTTPNRLHLWTGTIRARQSPDAKANVLNSDVDFGRWASWPTFPERLEDRGISWKIYQNELTIESGLSNEENDWLGNFDDNTLEFFAQYHVRHSKPHREFIKRRITEIPAEIEHLRKQLPSRSPEQAAKDLKQIAELTKKLQDHQQEVREFTDQHFDQLPRKLKNLHTRAFDTNSADPDYRRLTTLTYRDGDQTRTMNVPKGDILFQFRQDVASGRLPTVSWLVGPEKFSDHPSSPWYGAWYISEILNILTKNPKVWQKTIFILTYDENDGYFDHVPPFVAPHPKRPDTGRVTSGIDASLEYVELEQDMRSKPRPKARDSAIGLGYRVPMIIASPWSRGGCVCSQVFDHTSTLQFLEKFLSHKTGREVSEPNINHWRRTVCGDLTAAFQNPTDHEPAQLPFHHRDEFVQGIHRAQFQPPPTGFRSLDAADMEKIHKDPAAAPFMPRQEPGRRRSAPLPYELVVNGRYDANAKRFVVRLEAQNQVFGLRAAGAPFIAYAIQPSGDFAVRNYAIEPGRFIEDHWSLASFAEGLYRLRIDGPNGFCREFQGTSADHELVIQVRDERRPTNAKSPSGNIEVIIVNDHPSQERTVEVSDQSYGSPAIRRTIAPQSRASIVVDTSASARWYDFSVVSVEAPSIQYRYCGRVENGEWGVSDPALDRPCTR